MAPNGSKKGRHLWSAIRFSLHLSRPERSGRVSLSYFHIIELAHLDADHKADALARAQFVQLVCGKRTYLHPSKLRCFEALSLVQSGQPETKHGVKSRAYVDDASWLPDSIVNVATRFTEALRRGLHNRIVKQTLEVVNEVAAMISPR